MSRIAKNPILIPDGVGVKIDEYSIVINGPLGVLQLPLCAEVGIHVENGSITFLAKSNSKFSRSMSGTLRSLLSNMVTGVYSGFNKRLQLVGVGYRAQAQGDTLNLSLGFSHPIIYKVPTGVSVQTPSQTEIVLKGANKQLVGQVAAEIRAYRPPEPYKGKGVRYVDERIVLKETKKK